MADISKGDVLHPARPASLVFSHWGEAPARGKTPLPPPEGWAPFESKEAVMTERDRLQKSLAACLPAVAALEAERDRLAVENGRMREALERIVSFDPKSPHLAAHIARSALGDFRS